MTIEEQWVWLAKIRRTQGRKGEVFADILTDFPERFAARRSLWLLTDETAGSPQTGRAFAGRLCAPRAVELTDHWLHKGGIVLHFAGIESISDAEALAGLIVALPSAERAELEPDSFYIGDLIGCTLIDTRPEPPRAVGRIEDVDKEAGPVALLVVAPEAGGESILIPFAKSFLHTVDVAGGRIEMELPEGLVELNAGPAPAQPPEETAPAPEAEPGTTPARSTPPATRQPGKTRAKRPRH